MIRFLFVAPINKESNLAFALRCLRDVEAEQITFDIFGEIQDFEYWHTVQQEIAQLPQFSVSVRYFEDQEPDFSEYDFFILPRKETTIPAMRAHRSGLTVLQHEPNEEKWKKVLQIVIAASQSKPMPSL